MGTKLTVKNYHSTKNTMPCGVHMVFIQAMKMARAGDGSLLGTEDGEMAIDICFENKAGQQATQRFWTTTKAMWMLEALCKAVGVTIEGRQASKKEMIGKKLWLLVGAKYTFENGDLVRNGDGTPFAETRIITKFYPVISEDMPPMIQGDPAKNNGIPGGDFLLNTDLDIEAYWEKKEKFKIETPSGKYNETFLTHNPKIPEKLQQIADANPGRINIVRMQPNPNADKPVKKADSVVKKFNDEF